MSSSADEPFDETMLSAYLDQELEPSERLKVERELDKSPELRTLFAELSQIRNLVATCNIPLASELKAISGPWDSRTTTTIVSPVRLDSSHSAWTKNWTRLASLAAAIALLLSLGSIAILSTSTGRWISSRSTNEKVARRESKPAPAPSTPAPSTIAPTPSGSLARLPPAADRASPGTRAPKAIAPAAGSMKTDDANVAADSPQFKPVSANESLVSKFIQYLTNDAEKKQLKRGNDNSLADDRQELNGVFRVQAKTSSDLESRYLLFFDDAKGGKAETLAFESHSESLERQLGENRDKRNEEVIDNQRANGDQRKGQGEVKEHVVELIVPEEKWDEARALLVEKGFAIEDMRSNRADTSTHETLTFRGASNPLSPTGWTIVPSNNNSLGKEDTNSALIAEPAQSSSTEASRPYSRQSDQVVVELKDTGRKYRRIRVTLSEETTKSRSNE